MTTHPIHYKVIKTQYAFLVSEESGKYRVQVQPITRLTDQVFDTKEEVRKFISKKVIY
jgi:hypothetical protein